MWANATHVESRYKATKANGFIPYFLDHSLYLEENTKVHVTFELGLYVK